MTEKRFGSHAGVGSMTLMLLLFVLMMTVFAVLTLATARADLRLTERNAETVSAFYEAEAAKAEALAQREALASASES